MVEALYSRYSLGLKRVENCGQAPQIPRMVFSAKAPEAMFQTLSPI